MVRLRLRLLGVTLLGGAILAAGALTAPAAATSTSNPLSRSLPDRLAMPALLPDSKESTSAIVQNDGTAPATISMDLYTPAGVLIPSASQMRTDVPPGGTRTFVQAASQGLAPGFRGVAVLGSDQPVNALLARDIEENGTGKKSYSIHGSFATGGNTVTLPYVANNLNGTYQTRFAVANSGTVQACVTIRYAFSGGGGTTDNGPGGNGCVGGYPVPVGGQVAFGPTAVSAEATQAMPGATAGKLMAATITSTGAPVTVAADAYLTGGLKKLGSYDGFIYNGPAANNDDLGTTVAIPLAAKTSDGFYTQILISNPNAAAAHATITYRSGAGQTYTKTLTITPQGSAAHSVYEDTTPPIPFDFVGAATVTSDQPVAAVLFRAKMTTGGSFVDEDLYTAVNGIPTDRATTTAKLPLVARHAYGNDASCDASGSTCGYNSWVSVQVVDGTTANVTLTTTPDPTTAAPGCTSSAPLTATRAVVGSFVFYQNANSDSGLGSNPSCLWGGMVITSDKPILVIADVTSDLAAGDNDGAYNAFSS